MPEPREIDLREEWSRFQDGDPLDELAVDLRDHLDEVMGFTKPVEIDALLCQLITAGDEDSTPEFGRVMRRLESEAARFGFTLILED